MKAVVHGIRKLDFETNNGDSVKGTQIFVSFADENVEGHMTDKIFVSDKDKDILPVFKFGETYDFKYEVGGLGKSAKPKLVEIKAVPNAPKF